MRLPWSSHATTAVHAAAMIAATSLSAPIGTPPITIGSASTGSEMPAGTPPKASAAAPRTSAPSPMVTMMTEIAG